MGAAEIGSVISSGCVMKVITALLVKAFWSDSMTNELPTTHRVSCSQLLSRKLHSHSFWSDQQGAGKIGSVRFRVCEVV